MKRPPAIDHLLLTCYWPPTTGLLSSPYCPPPVRIVLAAFSWRPPTASDRSDNQWPPTTDQLLLAAYSWPPYSWPPTPGRPLLADSSWRPTTGDLVPAAFLLWAADRWPPTEDPPLAANSWPPTDGVPSSCYCSNTGRQRLAVCSRLPLAALCWPRLQRAACFRPPKPGRLLLASHCACTPCVTTPTIKRILRNAVLSRARSRRGGRNNGCAPAKQAGHVCRVEESLLTML